MDITIDLTKPGARHQLRAAFPFGSYVLYRDPAKYLAGEDSHTSVCRVSFRQGQSWNRLTLRDARTEQLHRDVHPDYVRPLSAAEVMRDIDAAALEHSGELLAAGDAWLRKQRTAA